MTTNDPFPVKVECTDRRYLVLTPSANREGDRSYFDNLLRQVQDPLTAVHFYKFLEQFDAGVDLHTWTAEKAELMSVNIPLPAQFLQHLVSSGEIRAGLVENLATMQERYCMWNSDVVKDKAWKTFFNQIIKQLPITLFKSSVTKLRFNHLDKLEAAMRGKQWWHDDCIGAWSALRRQ